MEEKNPGKCLPPHFTLPKKVMTSSFFVFDTFPPKKEFSLFFFARFIKNPPNEMKYKHNEVPPLSIVVAVGKAAETKTATHHIFQL